MHDPQTIRRKTGIQGFEVQVQWRSGLQTLKLKATHTLETPEITPRKMQRHVPEIRGFKTKTIS